MLSVFVDLEPNIIISLLGGSTQTEYYKRYFRPKARMAALFMSKEVTSELCKVSY